MAMKHALLAIVLMALGPTPAIVAANTDGGSVTGAATGSFAPGATLGPAVVEGLELGTGVLIEPNGSAEGTFHAVLRGKVFGEPRRLTLEGKISQGTIAEDGSATFSGPATLSLGDGTPATPVLWFSVTVGTKSVVLNVDTETLPAVLTSGEVVIE
jgi:hypothetical protein